MIKLRITLRSLQINLAQDHWKTTLKKTGRKWELIKKTLQYALL